jgi:two-component system nitrogen regulation sensor histidine kinase NtrY
MTLVPSSRRLPLLRRRLIGWAARVSLGNKLAYGLIAASLISGVATYYAMTAAEPLHWRHRQTPLLLLNLDLVLLLILGVVVGRRMVVLWNSRKRGLAGARLQSRVVLVFSVLAAVPSILTAIFSAIFFHVGVDAWFSNHVSIAVDESLAVAQAYLHEHQQAIRADALAMANDLDRDSPWLLGNSVALERAVRTQALMRNMNEAIILDGSGKIMAKSGFALALQFETADQTQLDRARDGEVLIMSDSNDDRVRALLHLNGFIDSFLYVERRIEPNVLSQIQAAQNAVVEYRELEARSTQIQVEITMIFLIIALLMLMAAVWLGIAFAKYLVTPIAALIDVTEQVRAGDLTARVAESGEDELATLSRAFNRMTSQLAGQRRELVDANYQMNLRRQFTETVLAGVSAGVVGLDVDGRITICNISAAQFLGTDPDTLMGRYLADFIPELTALLESITPRSRKLVQTHIDLRRPGMPERSFLLRVTAESQNDHIRGYVATFDDLTDLMTAQRKAAWADVARRIAHEIKNPLTPIQLSAERLKRKYTKEIQSDPETFAACTDTIIRHVGDIGRMVDEFSAFARMPDPVFRLENLTDLCRQLTLARTEAYSGIGFEFEAPDQPIWADCDGRLIGQAFTNLLQNAIEAIDGRTPDSNLARGLINVRLTIDNDDVVICVDDNGKGLPVQERERLTEPYVTTRAKGTGLGLAIVKKIMEDHGGRLTLDDRVGGGTSVRLILPAHQQIVAN